MSMPNKGMKTGCDIFVDKIRDVPTRGIIDFQREKYWRKAAIGAKTYHGAGSEGIGIESNLD